MILDICDTLLVFQEDVVVRPLLTLRTIKLEDGSIVSDLDESYLVRFLISVKDKKIEEGFMDIIIARKGDTIYVIFVNVYDNFSVEKKVKSFECGKGVIDLMSS